MRAGVIVLFCSIMMACQSKSLPRLSALPTQDLRPPQLSVDRHSIRLTSGYEMTILFERFEKQGKLAFCTFGVAREHPGNLPRLWLDSATIYFGEQPIASGAMIPIHLLDEDGRYVSECVETDLEFDRHSLSKASIKGRAVYGEV